MNLVEELSKLADLRASGVLTEEEFQDAKAQLLGMQSESQREELKRIETLYHSGALTQKEFEAAKTAILSRGAKPSGPSKQQAKPSAPPKQEPNSAEPPPLNTDARIGSEPRFRRQGLNPKGAQTGGQSLKIDCKTAIPAYYP